MNCCYFPIGKRSGNIIYCNKTFKIVVFDVTFRFSDNFDVTGLLSSRKPEARIIGVNRLPNNIQIIGFYIVYKSRSQKLLNLDKTSNCGQQFVVQEYLMRQTTARGCWFYPGLAIFKFFIYRQSNHLYVVWQTMTPTMRASGVARGARIWFNFPVNKKTKHE